MTEVQLPFDAVRRHAASVDGVARDVDLARAATASVQLGREAYGKLCQFLPTLLEPVAGAAVDALTESVASLQETATNLRTTADRAQSTDRTAARRVDSAGPRHNWPL